MNNKEAKFLLQGYRPNGRDAQDPQFIEALEQVKRDPVLTQWFSEQQTFDHAISEKVQSLPVPANLKADILAGRKTLRPTTWWTRRSTVTALAACFVAMLGLVAILMSSPGSHDFATYRAEMVRFVTDVEKGREPLQLTSGDLASIQGWISENSIHKNVELPRSLTAGSGVGCRVMDWKGESVALACFRLGGGKVAHLLVIDRKSLLESPGPGEQYVASLEGMNTAAWSGEAKTFLLVSSASNATLQGLL